MHHEAQATRVILAALEKLRGWIGQRAQLVDGFSRNFIEQWHRRALDDVDRAEISLAIENELDGDGKFAALAHIACGHFVLDLPVMVP